SRPHISSSEKVFPARSGWRDVRKPPLYLRRLARFLPGFRTPLPVLRKPSQRKDQVRWHDQKRESTPLRSPARVAPCPGSRPSALPATASSLLQRAHQTFAPN